MKAEEKKLLTEFLGKTVNLPAEIVATLFEKKDGEEDETFTANASKIMLDADAARIKGIKEKLETAYGDKHSKAKSEILTKYEADLKAKHGIESDKQGIELIDEIIAAKIPADKATDEDKIKRSKIYMDLEKEMAKKVKEATEAGELKVKEIEQNYAKKETFSTVKTHAEKLLSDLKPILSKDADKAANQKKILMDELNGYEFELNGNEITVLKEGKRLEDQHGKPVSFASLVKDTAGKYWDFEQGDTHQGAGAGKNPAASGNNGAAGAATKYNGKLPANDEEYSAIFLTLKTAEERIAFDQAVEAQKAKV